MRVYIDPKFSNDVNARLIYLCVGMSPYAQLIVDRVNIYCVTSDVVDYVCPPRMRRYIDPECLEKMKGRIKEFMDRFSEEVSEVESIERVFEKFWGVISECRTSWGVEIFRACYKNLDISEARELEKFGVSAEPGPNIFLAIDRIKTSAMNISKKIGTQIKEAFIGVLALSLVHETFHAYTDISGKKYSYEVWHTIIEESLATYTEYLYVKRRFIPIFIADMENMPLEYRAWEYWRVHAPNRILHNIVSRCWAQSAVIPQCVVLYPIFHSIFWPIPVGVPSPGYPHFIDILHEYFAMLGPGWHRFFHEVILPALKLSKQKQEILWQLLAINILKYMLRI